MNMTSSCLSVLLLLVISLGVIQAINPQSAAVKGKLMCGEKPAAGVTVLLVDDDTGLDPDDKLQKTETDTQGNFYVSGTEDEITPIDLFLKIYHNCMDGLTPCDRRWKFGIPNWYIHSGNTSAIKNVLDIGTMNLALIMEKEEHDCWN